jgi:hypothetical protein
MLLISRYLHRRAQVQAMDIEVHMMQRKFATRCLSLFGFLLCHTLAVPVSAASLVPEENPSQESNASKGEGRIAPSDASVSYWSQGKPRPFLAGRAFAGLGFGRLILNGGYGKPHWTWLGPEAVGTLTLSGTTAQVGFRLSAVVVELALYLKHTESFRRGFVFEKDAVSAKELEQSGNRARYDSFDASLSGLVPYRRFVLGWDLSFSRPIHQDSDSLVYEESLHVVIGRQGVFDAKFVPMMRLHRERAIYAGLLLEPTLLIGRTEPFVFRLGPSASVKFSAHWELFCFLSWPVNGVDRLGFLDGMNGSTGVIYRFATSPFETLME